MAVAPRRMLIAGESWIMHTIHQKGVDSFTTTAYGTGHQWLQGALEAGGWEVDHLPNHLAPEAFPTTMAELDGYDVVILSDIGANSLLLSPDTFDRSLAAPNRLALLREWVRAGGGLVMVGGYLTFQGIEAKGHYAGSPVEEALPVTIHHYDDRIERPEGIVPEVSVPDHPLAANLPGAWPLLLGYNQLTARPEATTVAVAGPDPLVVAWEYGQGRAVAFASDCGPHWAPLAFVEWPGYAILWQNIANWAAGSQDGVT
ncbi:MAG TPA: glutamine amidotransferase [Thermomicrobiales bacterium]|nr:glutamine amidotransferase [Thermomicrobiales bacterium]